MFTLWYSILSYKEYRDVIFAPASTAPPKPALAPASAFDIKPPPITPQKAPAEPTPPSNVTPPRTLIPSVVPPTAPLLPPAKPPRSPSPHPMMRSDVLDDIDFDDEDLLDEDDNENNTMLDLPRKAPFGDISNFLQEEIRSGGARPDAVQKTPDIPRAR